MGLDVATPLFVGPPFAVLECGIRQPADETSEPSAAWASPIRRSRAGAGSPQQLQPRRRHPEDDKPAVTFASRLGRDTLMLVNSYIDLLVMEAKSVHHGVRRVLPKTNAALDVGEEECDDAVWQVHELKLLVEPGP